MRLPVDFYFTKDFGVIIGELVILGKSLFGTESDYDQVIPYVRKCYRILVEEARKGKLKEALDEFLEKTSTVAILNESFKICLARELGTTVDEIEKALLSTNYIKKRLSYLKRYFKKMRKENPVDYAETFGELIALIGLKKTSMLLKQYGLKVGTTTLRRLYKVSMMPIKIKRMIENGELLLTVAFELPEDSLEIAAEKVAGLKYYEALNVLRRLK